MDWHTEFPTQEPRMPGPIAIACPNCRVKLKIKSASAFGKRKRCPKCNQPFVVPTPAGEPAAEVVDEFDDFGGSQGFDDFGHFETGGFDDFEASQPRPRRRSGQRSRKAAQKPGWVKPALIGGGSLLGVLLIAGGILLAVNLAGTEPATSASNVEDPAAPVSNNPGNSALKDPMPFLKSGTDAVVVAHLGRLRSLREVDDAIQKSPVRLDDDAPLALRDQWPKTMDDVEMLAVAWKGTEFMKNPSNRRRGLPPNVLVVLRLKRAWPWPEMSGLSETRNHQGKPYLRFRKINWRGYRECAIRLDDRTLVSGSETMIQRALDGPSAADERRFAFADFKQDAVFVIAPSHGSLIPPEAGKATVGWPKYLRDPFELARRDMQGLALGINVKDGVDCHAKADFRSPSNAAMFDTQLNDLLRKGQNFIDLFGEKMPQDARELFQNVLADTKVRSEGNRVILQVHLSRTAIDGIKMLAEQGRKAKERKPPARFPPRSPPRSFPPR